MAESSRRAMFTLGSTVLSEAIPLSAVPPRSKAERRRNFFHELLPEGRALTNLATRIGASESDTIGLLAQYGRDVAGAIQIFVRADPTSRALRGPPSSPLRTSPSSLSRRQASPWGTRPDPARHRWLASKKRSCSPESDAHGTKSMMDIRQLTFSNQRRASCRRSSTTKSTVLVQLAVWDCLEWKPISLSSMTSPGW